MNPDIDVVDKPSTVFKRPSRSPVLGAGGLEEAISGVSSLQGLGFNPTADFGEPVTPITPFGIPSPKSSPKSSPDQGPVKRKDFEKIMSFAYTEEETQNVPKIDPRDSPETMPKIESGIFLSTSENEMIEIPGSDPGADPDSDERAEARESFNPNLGT